MADFQSGVQEVDDHTHVVLYQTQFPNVMIKNLGPETIFLAPLQDSNPSGTVDPETAVPLYPGDTVTVPSCLPGVDTTLVGANTMFGASRVATIGVN